MKKIKEFFIDIASGFKNFRKNTKGMSFREFLSYIKDYYLKDALIFGVIFGILIAILVTSFINRHTEILLSGVAVNVNLSTEGTLYAKDEYFEKIKSGGRQKIDFACVTIDNFDTTDDAEASYYSAQSIIAQVSAKRIDYLIMDEVAFQFFASQEIYMDLRDILSEEELEEWKDNIVYTQEEESDQMFPTGIKITDTKFVKKNNPSKEDVFFSFIVNAPNKDEVYDFFHYLMQYK